MTAAELEAELKVLLDVEAAVNAAKTAEQFADAAEMVGARYARAAELIRSNLDVARLALEKR